MKGAVLEAFHQPLAFRELELAAPGLGEVTVEVKACGLCLTDIHIAEGRVPRTLNYERPDPACPVNVIHGSPLPVDKKVVLKLNQSLTGQAVAMVISGV